MLRQAHKQVPGEVRHAQRCKRLGERWESQMMTDNDLMTTTAVINQTLILSLVRRNFVVSSDVERGNELMQKSFESC